MTRRNHARVTEKVNQLKTHAVQKPCYRNSLGVFKESKQANIAGAWWVRERERQSSGTGGPLNSSRG